MAPDLSIKGKWDGETDQWDQRVKWSKARGSGGTRVFAVGANWKEVGRWAPPLGYGAMMGVISPLGMK